LIQQSLLPVINGLDELFTERSEPINAYHLLVSSFSSFIGSVVCHTLALFGKSPLCIISFDFLYAPPLLLSFPVLSAFTLIPTTVSLLGISHAACAGARDSTQMWYNLS